MVLTTFTVRFRPIQRGPTHQRTRLVLAFVQVALALLILVTRNLDCCEQMG